MSSRLTRFVSIGFLLCLCVATPHTRGQSAPIIALSGVERTMQNCQLQVASWQRDADIEIALAVVIIILGGAVSFIQKANTQLAKWVTVGLGVAISILTGVNSRIFIADDRTLRRAAFDGSSVVNELLIISDEMKDTSLTDDNRSALKSEFLKKLSEFHSIGEKLNGTEPTPSTPQQAASLVALTPVYADSESKIPDWVKNPPSNDVAYFFVGKGYDTSLSNAKKVSIDDAFSNAIQALRPKAPNASDSALLSLIKASSLVQDSSFTYDNKTRTYAYYTLLRLSRDIEKIGLQSLPEAANVQSAQFKVQNKSWQPGDLAAGASSGLFVLATDGGVFRLNVEKQGPPRLDKLFRVSSAYTAYAVAASADSVFVAASSKLGCTVFKYGLSSKSLAQRLVVPNGRCVGIATDGSALYLTFPDQKEIRYLQNWDASSRSWPFADGDAPGYITFDDVGHRLIVADASGKAYSVSTADGSKQLMASNLGSVASIATSRFHILVASGKKVLFLARSDGHGENPPAGLQVLTGGHIVGVAVDASDRLWFADYDKKIVEGPFPLS